MRAKLGVCVVLCVAALYAPLAFSQCNCLKFPFEPNPPCEDQCLAKILNESDPLVLRSELGLSSGLVDKIQSVREKDDEATLADYKKKLTADEFSALKSSSRSLTTGKLARLQQMNEAANQPRPKPLPFSPERVEEQTEVAEYENDRRRDLAE